MISIEDSPQALVKGHTAEWQPISALRPVDMDISDYAYSKEYIAKHNLLDAKRPLWTNTRDGRINFYEPIEVMAMDGKVFFRINENRKIDRAPDHFDTQFGRFNNHNHGEFHSWLGRDGYEGLSAEERKVYALLGRDDYFIEGNYCDMFDCGEYSYAISNLLHLGLGRFKIVQIDQKLETATMYENGWGSDILRLAYLGRYENNLGFVVIASGHDKQKRGITLLFLIDRSGTCTISQEWDFSITSISSLAVVDGIVYFGQNKMVTCLNVKSGEITYLTNKSEEELAVLKEFKW